MSSGESDFVSISDLFFLDSIRDFIAIVVVLIIEIVDVNVTLIKGISIRSKHALMLLS